eukprot:GHVS01104916.1.p1 GENE.GHVS01104916.1~~GHVS01104916.1.p1  ORF type:complete len:470 (+),score=89.58 GHVS01104916.1:77-1486(+)
MADGGPTGGALGSLVRTYTLQPCYELRIIAACNAPTPTTVKVLPYLVCGGGAFGEGFGEEFGRELVVGREYEVSGRTAIFTWGRCKLELRGLVLQEYEGLNLAMKEYLSLSQILDARRELSAIQRAIGPRVLVTGAGSSGKSSLCSLLCNYAVRAGKSPLFVELDIRGSTDRSYLSFFPGCIGCTEISSVHSKEPKDPLCFFFGRTEAQEDRKLFLQLCEQLSLCVYKRLAANLEQTKWQTHRDDSDAAPLTAASGLIVNAPYECGSTMLMELVEIFGIDVIVVLDNPSLKQKLALSLPPDQTIAVVGLPKQGGVVSVDKERLRELRLQRYSNYFSGRGLLSVRVRLSELHLVMVDSHQTSQLPDSARSADSLSVESASGSRVDAVEWCGGGMALLNAVLGVSAATHRQHVHTSPAVGLAFVKNVEEREDVEGAREFMVDLLTYVPDVIARQLVVPGDKLLKWWDHQHF